MDGILDKVENRSPGSSGIFGPSLTQMMMISKITIELYYWRNYLEILHKRSDDWQ